MRVPGAGLMLEQLRVPDISYDADDVSLIAYDDPAQAQHPLDLFLCQFQDGSQSI